MSANEKITLIRQNEALSKENAELKKALVENRTALTHAQLTTQLLAQIGQGIVDAARKGVLDNNLLINIEQDLNQAQDTDWLVELHREALERGFDEGYRFCFTQGRQLGGRDNAVEALKAKTSSLWPATDRLISRFQSRRREAEPCRYRYDPNNSDSPFDFDNTGDYTDYAAYVNLKLRHDALKEELDGYRWLLHDPLRHTQIKPTTQHESNYPFVRRPRKAGVLKAQYGRNQGESDFFVLYGDGVPACDRALIFHAFGSKRSRYDYDLKGPAFDPSLLQELSKRGYDLSTLRFSICKRQDIS